MTVLSIDTAANCCAVALSALDSGNLLAETTQEISRGHGEILIDNIDEILAQSRTDYNDITRIIVTIGPGSFSGVRVGLACARAFGLALNIPVIGVSNLEACARFAMDIPENPTAMVSVALDARRDAVYFQQFLNNKELAAPIVIDLDELVTGKCDFFTSGDFVCGSGTKKLMLKLHSLKGPELKMTHQLSTVPIEVIARLGMTKSPPATSPEPLYLRSPDAKPQAGFAIAKAAPFIDENAG